MYAHFYQLAEDPFNLTPDPKFHYVNQSTREAMAAIAHGIRSRKGFLTLIGEAGTGKTTLLKRIVDEVEGETQVVFVFNPGISFDELLEFICVELGIETEGAGRLHRLDRLNEYLLEQLSLGRNVVVMIDEAQTLDDSVLEELRLLSNLETSKEKILQILLSGQPELEDKLRRPALRQLRQRIAARATLKAMRSDEISAYVETRLRSAGASRGDFFTPGALRLVWQASNGIPRVINVICDNAMMIAFADGKLRITPGVMREAVRDLSGAARRNQALGGLRAWAVIPGARYIIAAVVILALAVPVAMSIGRGPLTRLSAFIAAKATQVTRLTEQSGTAVPAPAPLPVAQYSAPAVPALPDLPSSMTAPAVGLDEGSGVPVEIVPDASPALHDTVAASIRRAQVVARSTAARLYDRRRASLDETATRVLGSGPGQLADSARRELGGQSAPIEEAAREELVRSRAARLPSPGDGRLFDTDDPFAVSPGFAEPVGAGTFEADSGARLPAFVGEDSGVADAQFGAGLGAQAQRGTTRATRGDGRAAASPPVSGVGSGEPRIGQLVRVLPGDTVWDIAVAHYGSAGPGTLKSILKHNPGVLDPRRLEVGSYMFLPFQRPEQMVRFESDSTFRVLLSASPERGAVEAVSGWVRSIFGDVELGTMTVSGGETVYQLYAVGIRTRESAVTFATDLLNAYDRVRVADGRSA